MAQLPSINHSLHSPFGQLHDIQLDRANCSRVQACIVQHVLHEHLMLLVSRVSHRELMTVTSCSSAHVTVQLAATAHSSQDMLQSGHILRETH